MTLIIISIPLMVLAVAIAVVPLIAVSWADHRRRLEESIPRTPQDSCEAATVGNGSVPLAA